MLDALRLMDKQDTTRASLLLCLLTKWSGWLPGRRIWRDRLGTRVIQRGTTLLGPQSQKSLAFSSMPSGHFITTMSSTLLFTKTIVPTIAWRLMWIRLIGDHCSLSWYHQIRRVLRFIYHRRTIHSSWTLVSQGRGQSVCSTSFVRLTAKVQICVERWIPLRRTPRALLFSKETLSTIACIKRQIPSSRPLNLAVFRAPHKFFWVGFST